MKTFLNYNCDEGERLLSPQGWVNYLNVVPSLAKEGVADDQVTTERWKHNKTNPLKVATKVFYNKNRVLLQVRPHLDAFHTSRLLVPYIENKLELFCNTPDFFLIGGKPTAKKPITLTDADLNVKLYLCSRSDKRQAIGRPARYPVVCSKIRTFTLAGDTTKFEKDDVFMSELPVRMIVGLLDSHALNGDLEYYPFAFQKFGSVPICRLATERRRRITHGEALKIKRRPP